MLEKTDFSKQLSKEEYKLKMSVLKPRLGELQRQCRQLKIPVMIVFEGFDVRTSFIEGQPVFVGKDVAFDGKQAGKKGYILYDWEGDGEYDHIEFGSISEDGLSYSYYSNNGFENGENYYTRSFAQDSNAHCDNNGNGIVRFIPLN